MADELSRVETIFHAAVELPAPQERTAFLDRACGGDADLRQKVEALLAAHDAAEDVLRLPYSDRTLEAPVVSEGPGTTIGRYKLLEQIGEGGFGVVFMAEQQQPVRRKVALKVIKLGMDTKQVIARFEAERQALAMMDHPNIAHVFDAGATETGRPYFVMELVRGIPITDYCDQNKLSTNERLELFRTVCSAVQHAHTKGIIHRDIKPTNVLVTLNEGVAVPKVIDFGIAKATGQQLTEKTLFTNFAQMIGTPLYMSPEQAEMTCIDVDTRSDVYSLGVLLYELLTGTTPLDQDRLKQAAFDEIRRIIREEEPPRPSTRLSTMAAQASTISAAQRKSDPKSLSRLVRGELDWIVMKALEKQRNRRYETANGLARDIERYLQDEAVEACPASAAYRLRKFVRRNKGPVLAVAIVLLALTAGVIGTAVGLVRAERAQRAERQAKQHAEAREAETNAVLAFVQDKVIAAAKPEGFGGLGAEVSLRRAIEAALPSVETSFAEKPLIEARLRMTLGLSFQSLGQQEIAAAQYERAHSLYEKQLGSDDPRTLSSMRGLTVCYHNLGRIVDAAKLNENVLAMRTKKLGPEHPDTLTSMNDLAINYEGLHRYPEALTLNEQVLKVRRAALGPDDPETLKAMNYVAQSYRDLRRSGEARTLLEDLVSRAKAKLGPEDYVTLRATETLAECYREMGQKEQALKLNLEVLALMKSKLGPDNPNTLVSMTHAAFWLGRCGREDEAIELIDECVRRARANGVGAFLVNSAINQRLRYFEKRKDATGCRASAEMWEGFKLTKAGELYDAACFRAATAAVSRAPSASKAGQTADVEADRAMEWFTRAIAAGYIDIAHMKVDKDLDSLREREDFKRIFADLEANRPLIDQAWQLATDSDPSRRDPAKAVSLAQDAVAHAPSDAKWWSVLGVARYRAGDGRGALAAFDKHRELIKDEMAPRTMFFLAMSHWQVGEREEARQWYTRAVEAANKSDTKDAVMTAARAQATTMLGEKNPRVSNGVRDQWDREAWVLQRKNKLEEARELRARIVESATASFSRGDYHLVKYQCDYVELLLQMKLYPAAVAVARDTLESLRGEQPFWRPKCLGYLVEAYKQSANPQEEARYRAMLSTVQQASGTSTRPAGMTARLPVTRPSADAVEAEGFSPQRTPLGSIVTLRGRVGHISFASRHSAMNIEFATSDPEAIMVWFPPEVYSKLIRDAGQDAVEFFLTGQTICVRGRIERYGGLRPQWKDRLQLSVQDAHEFWLVADEPASPATAP